MKKLFLVILFINGLLLSPLSQADKLSAISNNVSQLVSILAQMQGIQTNMLNSQLDIQNLMKQVNDNLSGHSGWGNYNFHDYQSYGDGAHDWLSVMQMAESGRGSGALGQAINGISNQFPIDKNGFNKGVRDLTSQKYYAIQSETILATRAASQLDYDKIQDQITYQQMLQQQIEHTKDLKAAVDLNNRLQVEANLISLEILRQSALTNQQQAINEQAGINSALSNARFLTKE